MQIIADKKRLLLITGFCILCLVIVSFEGRFRSLRNDMRSYIESRATQAIGRRVSIGSLKGGIFKELYIRDFAIRSGSGKGDLFYADEMRINFKLWDILFAKKELSRRVEIHIVRPHLQGDFESGRIFATASNIVASWQGAFLARASHIHFEDGFRLHIEGGKIASPQGRFELKDIYGSVDAVKDEVKSEGLSADLFGVPIEMKGRIGKLNDAPQLDLHFSSDSAYVRGGVNIKGDITKPQLEIFVHPARLVDIYAAGYFSLERRELELQEVYLGADAIARQGGDETIKPKIKLLCEFSKLPAYAVVIKLNHVLVGGNDLLADIVFAGSLKESGDVMMEGEVDNYNTILNYKPFPDSSLIYAVKRDAVEIKEFGLGNSVKLSGSISLKGANALDMALELKDVDLEGIFAYSMEEAPSVSGIVNGRIGIKGDIAKPFLNGRLEASSGRMGPLNYDLLTLNLAGESPIIHFKDSKMVKRDTTLYLEGDVDLRRFGKSSVLENLKIKSNDKMIVWDGWDITKGKGEEQKLSLGKDVGDAFHIDFNTFLSKDSDLSDEKPQGEVEFGYNINDQGTFKVKLKGEERFLGIEHKNKF